MGWLGLLGWGLVKLVVFVGHFDNMAMIGHILGICR